MFESILEKILLHNFGQFIEKLDRNNIHLGVWSGNLIIENVSVKKDLLEKLELPLILKFSYIEKFQINLQWAKINYQPIEVIISNVFLIVSPKNKKDWNLSQMHNYLNKREILENFYKKYLEESLLTLKKKKNKVLIKINLLKSKKMEFLIVFLPKLQIILKSKFRIFMSDLKVIKMYQESFLVELQSVKFPQKL